MKITKFTLIALFAALMMAGCEPDIIGGNGGNGGTTDETSTTGLLSIAQLSVECRTDEKDPDTGVDPRAAATRSSVDVNSFDCSIINETGEVVYTFKFGERPTDAIELKTGDYIFKIQSGEIEGAAWDAPVYGTTKAFKIVRDETTTLSEVVCTLMQIKVSITYAPDLLERLGEETTTTAIIGENSLTYTLGESRAGRC